MSETNLLPVYEIRVAGQLDPAWSRWFNGLHIVLDGQQPPVTTLSGPVIDQAKLRGLLNKLWDLNLTVLSVNRIEPGAQS